VLAHAAIGYSCGCAPDEDCSIQILGRQYTFESEKGQRIALPRNSPGVVGATPLLAPGQTFEYASGVDIDAPRGSVTGCLHAVRKPKEPEAAADDEPFDAFVSKFALLAPHKTTTR
jgi:ApaG protein